MTTDSRQQRRAEEHRAAKAAEVAARDAALFLLRMGNSPIPVEFKSKEPGYNDWQALRVTEAVLDQHFNGRPQNIGVLNGVPSQNQVDVDLDAPEPLVLADFFLPATDCEWGRPSKQRSHRRYVADPPPATR